ncbi:CBS domain-containing protein [Spiribacter vilamensis]|uniref:CBS domain protein n=1 Tax=Spiribacter vilamensis TaxID=531306 RepID=A0A4Q8CYM2_9GAMM|nr:CBS domain-containing protein [Spiribacter vilamensis]RZU98079.1 CBS domain protein [Spiribacter vilamensis]TVO61019.1 CBS domain-containing protein [Spiribacter vilamensis]
MPNTMRSLLRDGSGSLQALGPDGSVADAVALMNRRNIGAVLVMTPDEALLGIFTERDVLRRVLGQRLDPAETPLESVMTREVFWIAPAATTDQALALVAQRNVRHLPVMDDQRVLGMISVRDLSAAVVRERDMEVAALTSYLHGSYGGHVGG